MSAAGRPKRDTVALVNDAATLWDQEHQDIGLLTSVFAQTALPYKNPGEDLQRWTRRNGNLTLIVSPGEITELDGEVTTAGYPYGSLPRLLLIWMSTEAVRTGEQVLPLGESLSDFMRQLDLAVTGGYIRKLRDQMIRLFNARISVHYRESGSTYQRRAAEFLNIASGYDLWWSERAPKQPALIPSYVKLTDEFFREVTSRPVPLDLAVIRRIRGSAMRLDIYAWLTYRMSYLSAPSEITWNQIAAQFGSLATSRQAQEKFKKDFAMHLREIQTYYPEARAHCSTSRTRTSSAPRSDPSPVPHGTCTARSRSSPRGSSPTALRWPPSAS